MFNGKKNATNYKSTSHTWDEQQLCKAYPHSTHLKWYFIRNIEQCHWDRIVAAGIHRRIRFLRWALLNPVHFKSEPSLIWVIIQSDNHFCTNPKVRQVKSRISRCFEMFFPLSLFFSFHCFKWMPYAQHWDIEKNSKKTEIFMRIFMFHLWLGFFFRSESVQLQCGFY